jgi:hypothetical protein
MAIGESCFAESQSPETVTFESRLQLSRIEAIAFRHCSSLSSICIPSSVEVVADNCFAESNQISMIRFDSNSQLSSIAASGFSNGPSLSSLYIPPRLEDLFAEYAEQLRISRSDSAHH